MVGRRHGWLLLSLAVTLLGVVIGCGSGDQESSAKVKQQRPESNEPPELFAKRLASLLATTTAGKDCAQLVEMIIRSPTRFPCPAPKDLRKSMASFKVVGAKEYGTGAVVDYKSGKAKDGAAIVLSVGPDRNWSIGRFGVITAPSTNTSDRENRAAYDSAVKSFLSAVRKRDCDALAKAKFTNGAKKEEVCRTTFAATSSLAQRLKANPSAKPKYQGGNATYGFYTLETAKPKAENSTISVIDQDQTAKASAVVLDVITSPTAAVQRRVRQELRKRRRPGDMSPSSKPSDPAVTTP